jgi:hypothetical protein
VPRLAKLVRRFLPGVALPDTARPSSNMRDGRSLSGSGR